MSDAQRLVDFLVYLIDEKYILSQYKPDGMGKAAQLVLNIFLWEYPRLSNVRDACQSVLMWRVLDQNYVHLEINLKGASLLIPADLDMKEKLQQVLPLDSITVIELMLDAARAIQYLHSMSVARPSGILRPTSQHPLSRSNVFDFGYFFYAALFNTEIDTDSTESKSTEERRRIAIVAERPSEPDIPEWQLIQRCCAEDPTNRPTIDEVVKEMETWGI
ncbi:hypothetical protein JOM56_002734 [Amanita muscaria]